MLKKGAPKRVRKVKLNIPLPQVVALKPKQVVVDERLPLQKYSYSTLVKFSSNPVLFKVQVINGEVLDSTTNVSAIMGRALHHALQVYYGGSDEYIVTNEAEGIELGLKAGVEYLEQYNDGFVSYSKTVPDKKKAIECFVNGFNFYINDPDTRYNLSEIIGTEVKLEHAINVSYRNEQLALPVRLNGVVDKITDSDGKLRVVDYKLVRSFSDPDKLDGQKMIQAIQYYLLAYAEYGREPYSIIFEEIKHTKNQKKGEAQVKRYEMVYSDNTLMFDFYFRLYEDVTLALQGQMVYVPNVHALFDGDLALIAYIHRLDQTDEVAKQMKKHKVSNVTDLLKRKIQKASLNKKVLERIEAQFAELKTINYDTMQNHEKIQTKLLEHGISLHHHSTINGCTVDLYQYAPSIGVKMKSLAQYVPDIEQVLGQSGVRILAPIPNTNFIGFEIPAQNRTYPELPKRGGGEFVVQVGKDVQGATVAFDIRKAPHVLVAGTTGSGKSVFLNSLITQLHKLPAKKAQTILIDPKEVELAQFADDKHVQSYSTTPEGIVHTLQGVTEEMTQRYAYLKKHGVKQNSDLAEPMPYLFIVIDEYADLALSDKKVTVGTKKVSKMYKDGEQTMVVDEVKKAGEVIAEQVQRLVQKARACGIHLVIATQRPSVKVINGDIKANLGTKVVFRVAKEVDSRIVLDEGGAEKLQGNGDALFSDASGITRVQAFNV